VEERGNTATFFRFLRKCISANKGRKVYLVVDNVRFHHARRLQPILERYRQRLELVFLPPYSPDLNPIERVWWLMRKQVTHNRWVKSMQERVEDFLEWCAATDKASIQTVCNLIEKIY
jgi:putative transposase